MSAVLSPAFGNPAAIRDAAVGNATFSRALRMGYAKFTAQALARKAKQCALACETPDQVAFRVVPPKTHSATTGRPGPHGGRAA